MHITEISVTAARTFNHPHEDYSNLRPAVVLRASVSEGEDPVACVRQLQAQAEGLVEDHKQGLLRSIEELHQLGQRQAEMRCLQSHLKRTQDQLDEIRKAHPELRLTNGENAP